MTRLDRLIGVVVAIVAGYFLFWPAFFGEEPVKDTEQEEVQEQVEKEKEDEKQEEPAKKTPVHISLLNPQPLPPPDKDEPIPAVKAEPPVSSPASAPPPPAPSSGLAAIHEPPSVDQPDGPGPGGDTGEDSYPALVIQWDGPDHIRAVALEKGFRIVAVGGSGRILGALSLAGALRLRRFGSSMSEYSNKVRSLPRSMFSGIRAEEAEIREFWLLVPVGEDQEMTWLIESAVREAGLGIDGVNAIQARFEKQSGRGYSLRVLKIEQP